MNIKGTYLWEHYIRTLAIGNRIFSTAQTKVYIFLKRHQQCLNLFNINHFQLSFASSPICRIFNKTNKKKGCNMTWMNKTMNLRQDMPKTWLDNNPNSCLNLFLSIFSFILINGFVLNWTKFTFLYFSRANLPELATPVSFSSPSSILNFSHDHAMDVIPTSAPSCTCETIAPCTSITMICPVVVPK